MRSLNGVSRNDWLRSRALIAPAILVIVGLLLVQDASAVDGNYSSPYASQWNNRNSAVSIPDETLLGVLLVLLNLVAATFFYLRDKLRRPRSS